MLGGDAQSATISRRESQRYAWSAGDPNPSYFDEGAARAAGFDGLARGARINSGAGSVADRTRYG